MLFLLLTTKYRLQQQPEQQANLASVIVPVLIKELGPIIVPALANELPTIAIKLATRICQVITMVNRDDVRAAVPAGPETRPENGMDDDFTGRFSYWF